MRYNPGAAQDAALLETLRPVASGLGLDIVELALSRHKGSVQLRVVIYKKGVIGVDDCSRVHQALLPRLELAFQEQDLYVEVSSTGIDREIKCGAEFAFYTGQPVKCYRTDISDWTAGTVKASDEESVTLETAEGELKLPFGVIAKAKFDS